MAKRSRLKNLPSVISDQSSTITMRKEQRRRLCHKQKREPSKLRKTRPKLHICTASGMAKSRKWATSVSNLLLCSVVEENIQRQAESRRESCQNRLRLTSAKKPQFHLRLKVTGGKRSSTINRGLG